MPRLLDQPSARRGMAAAVLVIALGSAAGIAVADGGGRGNRGAPAIVVAFPRDHARYNGAAWLTGCRNGVDMRTAMCAKRDCGTRFCRAGRGIRGTTSDPRGVRAVLVSIRRDATGMYWHVGSFSSRKEVYEHARLSRHGQRTSWFVWLGLPAHDGSYTVHVRATDLTNDVPDRRPPTSSLFIVDRVTPPPRLTARLAGPSSVRFWFTDSATGASFRCRQGAGRWRRCESPFLYTGLSAGAHTFAVRAVDHAGNLSAPVRHRWRMAATGYVRFSIAGRPQGLLYPGAEPVAIPVTLSNRTAAAIFVTSLTVSLDASSVPAGCAPGGFRITQSSVTAGRPIEVPAGGSVTLPADDASVPAIEMVDTHTNQDACEAASLTLDYAGRARS
jgi:hypothetical protein